MPGSEQTTTRACTHCSSSFYPRRDDEEFCCAGCRLVHDLITGEGFSGFYQLLSGNTLEPPSSLPISPIEREQIVEAVESAESIANTQESPARISLRLGNLSCTACIWLIDHLFEKQGEGLKVTSDTTRSVLTIWWNPGSFDVMEFAEDLHRFGYPPGVIQPGEEDDIPLESRTLVTRLGVTAALALNAMAFTLPSYIGIEQSDDLARLFLLVTFASASLAMAVGGSYFFQRAWNALRAGVLHMDVPISIGLITAFLGSLVGFVFRINELLYFDFAATFAFLMLLGRWIHLHLIERNRNQIQARERDLCTLFQVDPDNGERQRLGPKDVLPDQQIEIPPGGLVPVDGNLISEGATLHFDWINGEPEPVSCDKGQFIQAGARNASSHSLQLHTTSGYAGSLLEKLLSTESATNYDDNPAPQTTSLVLKIYLFAVIITALGGGIAWLAIGGGAAKSLQVFISVLVVSCPCALGLALPLVDEILLARLKKCGVFVRRNQIWSKLKRTNRFVFDKTGTLTEPVQRLTNPEPIKELKFEEKSILGILVTGNRHPAGRAIHEAIVEQFGTEFFINNQANSLAVKEVPGCGVQYEVNGRQWRLGKASWASNDTSSSATVFSRDGVPVATFHFNESIRDGAVEQINAFQKAGYQIRILSGDPDRDRVLRTAEMLQLDSAAVLSNFSPEEKATYIKTDSPQTTLFIGDGGNDSLAFDAALCSGTPATGIPAIESKADFVFTGRGFHALGVLFSTARRRQKIVAIVFAVAILYNIAAATVCLAGLMNPLLAAILMPLSSLVTTAIAARA